MSNRASILFTGDFCPTNRVGDLINLGDYEAIYNDFLPFIRKAEFAVTNLECPLTESDRKIIKIGPHIKASPEAVQALNFAGFKLVTLANNHIMDYSYEGLKSTVEVCRKHGIDSVGVGEDNTKARNFYTTNIGTYTVSFLNFTENEFSTTNGNYPGANPINPYDNYSDLVAARTISDYVFVIAHGGNDKYDLPSPRVKKLFHFYADLGADAIIGHHSHYYSGYEIYHGTPIFYGLGNFIFDKPTQRKSLWNYGYAVEIILGNETGYNLIPYEQCNYNIGAKLLDDNSTKEFQQNIERLNSIILDDYALEAEFERYCNSVKKMYSSFLEPHSCQGLHFLQNRKLLPSFLNTKKKTLYLNLIRCESHRDVLLDILSTRE